MSIVTNASLSAALMELSKLVAKVEDLPDMEGYAIKGHWLDVTYTEGTSAQIASGGGRALIVLEGDQASVLRDENCRGLHVTTYGGLEEFYFQKYSNVKGPGDNTIVMLAPTWWINRDTLEPAYRAECLAVCDNGDGGGGMALLMVEPIGTDSDGERWYELTLGKSPRYDLDPDNRLSFAQTVPASLFPQLLDGTYAGIKALDPSMGCHYLIRTCGTSTSRGWAGMSALVNDQTMIWAWLNQGSTLEIRARMLW